MSSTFSAEAVPSTTHRASGGRFAQNNPGGPGNPFARKTAALRAYLINHVTERDIQDILDILLLNAKGGHLPTIKFLFSYVLGKPKPAVEPDLLDLQEMQMLQQSALPPEALETVCGQLPLDFQVQLTRFTQAENAAAAFQTARHNEPADVTPQPTPAPSAPLTEIVSLRGQWLLGFSLECGDSFSPLWVFPSSPSSLNNPAGTQKAKQKPKAAKRNRRTPKKNPKRDDLNKRRFR